MSMTNMNVCTDEETKANEDTLTAFKEGDMLIADSAVKGYTSIDDLKKVLDL